MSSIEIEVTRDSSSKEIHELMYPPELGQVHIWYETPVGWRSFCGSPHDHKCPESADGHTRAMLEPGSKRCWCGAAICATCRAEWDRMNGISS